MKFTEDMLRQYAAPLSATEDQQCKNAIAMIRDALKLLGFTDDGQVIGKLYEDTLAYSLRMRKSDNSRQIKLFVQGSYANNTCVRKESDVDIAVIQEERWYPIYRPGITGEHYGFATAPVPTVTLKDEVQQVLQHKFGGDVERKNKSIKVHGNTYRKDADCVPSVRQRDYSNDYRIDRYNFVGGIVITADDGTRIINYPEQHIENGKVKNNETSTYYKKMVRIIKKMRYLMIEQGISSAVEVSSFGLESLLWNIPNNVFLKYVPIYSSVFSELVSYLQRNIHLLHQYKEANGIKPLCQDNSSKQTYESFIKDLSLFFEYDIQEG